MKRYKHIISFFSLIRCLEFQKQQNKRLVLSPALLVRLVYNLPSLYLFIMLMFVSMLTACESVRPRILKHLLNIKKDDNQQPTARVRRGKCKWFNVIKGWGFITPLDDGQDVFVHQSVIQMGGFRSLGDDEEVEFVCKVSEKGLEAVKVTGPQGADCKGSTRKPVSKKRFRKIRCYNCGEFANHIAAKCTMGPQPKRCHNCKSEDHLIADCPTKLERPSISEDSETPEKSP
ncbi:protein lin-28 homolog isoform X2 [Rhynchophorus ferrugineus]|uniref:protein lin-28 homolog isoform X2 n=1 Tax=Rhynchophorus ferrugineus TaxID=354439 RepID=UPI003FCC9CD2